MDKKPEDKPKAPASPAGAPPKKKKKKLDRFAPICIGILVVLMGLTFLQSLFGNRPNKVSSISESVTTYPSTETNPAETQTHSYALQSIDENELGTLATYFREHYYGFFLCDYNQPQSIDWSTVLVYVDAPQTKIPEEIKKSYLEKIQKKEGDVKLFAYNSYQIDQYVKETTTTNYADAKQPLHWDYDSNSQIYISYRPDVSPKEIKFTRGQKSGFDVTLYYKLKDANYPSTKVEHIMKLNFQGTIPKFISNMPST